MNDEPTGTNDLGPSWEPRVVRVAYYADLMATNGEPTTEMVLNSIQAYHETVRLLGPEFCTLLERTFNGRWLPLSYDGEEEKALTSVEGWDRYWEILPQLPEGGQWVQGIYLGA